MTKTLFCLAALTACSTFAMTRENLWKDGAPGAKGTESKDIPTLDLYTVENGNGAAIVVCPGGGYGHLATGHEGKDIAAWLNSKGIMCAVLEYRHNGRGYQNPAPLDDARHAIQTVRARAKEFGVDPAKIGVLGFSAGGHLAGSAATMFIDAKADAKDPVERVSSRPDFAVLCYPVLALGIEGVTHFGSQKNLLGEDASPEKIAEFSIDKRVTANTPPTFLWGTYEDKAVPCENMILYYQACRKYKVPAELHIYQKANHGVGLAKTIPGTANWPMECIDWMKNIGMVK